MMNNVKKRDVRKENMIISLVLWTIVTCVGMSAMLYVASRKTIVIEDTMREQPGAPVGADNNHGMGVKELLLQWQKGEENCIRIPLEKGTKAETVVMENRYMERELWIYLQDAEESFYEENVIYGDTTPIQSGYYENKKDGIILKLRMESVLEYRSTMENDTLVIAYYEPEDLYDLIVVVDPMGGGSDYGIVENGCAEKKIALQIAKQLQSKMEQDNIKIYYTRLEDVEVSYEDRLALVEAVNADLFIGIGACEDAEHSEYYGIHSFYNEEYFIPEFGNVQVADVLTRNVTVAANNRAMGVTPSEADSILQDIRVPAAEVCVGYMSNPKELALLQQEEYQEKLAEGLADAIVEVYTNKNKNDEVGEP